MKIKNIILPLLVSLITLFSCGPKGNSFRLRGTIQGMQGGEIYIYNTSVDNARFDTLRIDEEGKFYYGGSTEEVTPYIIVFPNALEQVVFIGPGEEIEYNAVSNDLNNYTSNGSEDNKLMNTFRQSISKKSYSDRQAKARKFINDNPKSPVSLYIFDTYFVQNAQTTYKELTDVQKMLTPFHKNSTYFMALEGRVKIMNELNVGDNFPNVKLANKYVTSPIWSGASSNYTTVLCWATWITSSYEVLAKVREIARENPKNKMRVVAFSIDNEFERWSNMTQFDSISTIEHYIDTRAFSSKLVDQIGINTLPTYFIMDSNHKIIAKGSETKALDEDVKKLLK